MQSCMQGECVPVCELAIVHPCLVFRTDFYYCDWQFGECRKDENGRCVRNAEHLCGCEADATGAVFPIEGTDCNCTYPPVPCDTSQTMVVPCQEPACDGKIARVRNMVKIHQQSPRSPPGSSSVLKSVDFATKNIKRTSRAYNKEINSPTLH